MSDNERDTHFAGFARLLWDDLNTKLDFWIDTTEPNFTEEFEFIIARRAYDLACHVATHTLLSAHGDMRKIPDMIEWPVVPGE